MTDISRVILRAEKERTTLGDDDSIDTPERCQSHYENRSCDLRHAHASIMLQVGVHPKVVSKGPKCSCANVTPNTCGHVLPSIEDGRSRKVLKAPGKRQ